MQLWVEDEYGVRCSRHVPARAQAWRAGNQCGISVLTPQRAATPNATTNASPMKRPDTVLLLQPWSTAVIQTTKSRMATTATALSHIVLLHVLHVKNCGIKTGWQAQRSQMKVMADRMRTLSSRQKRVEWDARGICSSDFSATGSAAARSAPDFFSKP